MMALDRVRLGLIGAGRIGQIHAENAVRFVPGCRLVSIADTNLVAARQCADRLGVERVYTDPGQVICDPEVDAVVICSSTDTHVGLIEACAEAGKHVLCEKPLSLELAAIDGMLDRVRSAGVKLMVGFNRRFDPDFRHIKEQIEDGVVGATHLIRITSRDPSPPPIAYVKVSGGMFMDMTIHDFDMARFLAGSEVTSVFAVGACRVDPAIGEAGDIDTAIVTLTFENGVLATIDNSRSAVYGYDQRVEVFGSGGMIWADNRRPHDTGRADASGMHTASPHAFFLERYAQAYRNELGAFVDCLLHDADPPVSGADGRAPMVIAMAAGLSMQQGRAFSPDEVDHV
jgi:myo-inositol 2-dehydrogenase/D-chiro-inositol 1-dehydrogenase